MLEDRQGMEQQPGKILVGTPLLLDHLHRRPPQHAHPLRAGLVDRRRRDAVRRLRLPPTVGRLPVLLFRVGLHVGGHADHRVDGGRGLRPLVAARLPRRLPGGGGGDGNLGGLRRLAAQGDGPGAAAVRDADDDRLLRRRWLPGQRRGGERPDA